MDDAPSPRPAKRARRCAAATDDVPLDARLPPELWSCVFAAIDTPEAAAAWRATCRRARYLFDTLPGHDPSCCANRALYEACRRGDETTVDRLLLDRRVVTALCAAPNPHGSLFGHANRWIAQRLLASRCRSDAGAVRQIPIATRDIEAACKAARDDDAVPLSLLAALPTGAPVGRGNGGHDKDDDNNGSENAALAVGISRVCLEAAVARRRVLLVRTLLAFVANRPHDAPDRADLPARAAIAAVRRRDMVMLRVVLDADGYRVSEAVLDRNHGDGTDQVDPLCEAVRRGWTDAVRLLANHRHYALVGPPEAPLGRDQRLARVWCMALAYWMAVRLRRAASIVALARSRKPPWCDPESPRAIDALLARGPTRTFVAMLKTLSMARKVGYRAAAAGRTRALGVILARVCRLCGPSEPGAAVFLRTVIKAAAAAAGGAHRHLSLMLTDALRDGRNAVAVRLLGEPSGAGDAMWRAPSSAPPLEGDAWTHLVRSDYFANLDD
ncbi:hypothetical protein pkur_cds_305 [Pandoravirus kuranda]|uniref:F-box domain containing protein n=1 Tax=Pandoravirus kuranda TaxID=3019033 RepID=A0AA95ECW8_9VIRU|nr:hypothetical protein pkur_cds_305 [Pandoravirus kuranda]